MLLFWSRLRAGAGEIRQFVSKSATNWRPLPPVGISELDAARLTTLPSAQVSVPRLAESPVNLECRLHCVVPIGDNRIVLAEVVCLHVRDEFLDGDPARPRVRTEALHLIGRMHGGGWYARTTGLFDLPRIPYEEWRKENG